VEMKCPICGANTGATMAGAASWTEKDVQHGELWQAMRRRLPRSNGAQVKIMGLA
jgi:hypothetical protein